MCTVPNEIGLGMTEVNSALRDVSVGYEQMLILAKKRCKHLQESIKGLQRMFNVL